MGTAYMPTVSHGPLFWEKGGYPHGHTHPQTYPPLRITTPGHTHPLHIPNHLLDIPTPRRDLALEITTPWKGHGTRDTYLL